MVNETVNTATHATARKTARMTPSIFWRSIATVRARVLFSVEQASAIEVWVCARFLCTLGGFTSGKLGKKSDS